jgi:hypothetical protein
MLFRVRHQPPTGRGELDRGANEWIHNWLETCPRERPDGQENLAGANEEGCEDGAGVDSAFDRGAAGY